MFTQAIQDILASRLQDMPDLVMAPTLTHDIDELVVKHVPAGRISVISDINTAAALGEQVFKALKGRFETNHILLPQGSKADERSMGKVAHESERADVLIAVGSGSISDVVKLTAYKSTKPYIVFPTAASMNGYVSRNASISQHGHKQSIAAKLPAAVFMDMSVICAAPLRLSQAGLGDSLARITAQADWLLSHHILGTDYDDTIFQTMTSYEPVVFNNAKGILSADREVMECLMKLLLLAGFGMTLAGSSASASGAEHMLAHAFEMSHAAKPRETLHGEEIALTTLHVAALQAQLLQNSAPRLLSQAWPVQMEQYFPQEATLCFKPLYEKKCKSITEALPGGEIGRDAWDKAREAIDAIYISADVIQNVISGSGLPQHPHTLGWNEEHYWRIGNVARFTRDRFTCLDVA